MAKMETAVQDLAVALEELSARAERNSLATAEQQESLVSMKHQASAAQKHAGQAARDLATSINELKTTIASLEKAERITATPTEE